jgi:tRNA dimethylallyltransferase
VRERLRAIFHEKGLEFIQQLLLQADPDYYRRVDLNNPKRILKALEVSEVSGRPYSGFLTGKPKTRPFSILKLGLDLPRTELHNRINRRTEMMVEQGLVQEARTLMPFRHLNALNTVGYKEVFDYLDGKVKLDEAIGQIQAHTRQYARRQLTWFRKDSRMTWFKPADTDQMIKWIREQQVK